MLQAIWFESIGSTQDYIKSHINELLDDTVVVANLQTNGRGRYGHVWHSSLKEGLYFSILKKYLSIDPLSLIVGVSLFKTIKNIYGFEPLIKWPNDIYILLEKPKKVAGILIERSKENTIIGIGVNLNQEDFPQDISIMATSLKLFSGKSVEKKYFLSTFFEAFYEDIRYFSMYGFEAFRSIINDHLLYKNKLVSANDGKVCGILKEVDKSGNIIIETNKHKMSLNAGELNSIRAQESW